MIFSNLQRGLEWVERYRQGRQAKDGIDIDVDKERSEIDNWLDDNWNRLADTMTIDEYAADRIAIDEYAAPGPPRSRLLFDAEMLITNQRNKDYGPPTENFANTAKVWNVLLKDKLRTDLNSTDVANLMVGLKLARTIQSNDNRDTFTDIAGYAACAWECQEEDSYR